MTSSLETTAPRVAPDHAPSVWLARVLRRLKPGQLLPSLPDDLELAWDLAAASAGIDANELARVVAEHHGLLTEPLPQQLPESAVALMRLPILRDYLAVPRARARDMSCWRWRTRCNRACWTGSVSRWTCPWSW